LLHLPAGVLSGDCLLDKKRDEKSVYIPEHKSPFLGLKLDFVQSISTGFAGGGKKIRRKADRTELSYCP
jgi:hypothetical protein